jgi:hypothetical protein
VGHIDGQSPSASCLAISMPMITEHASFDDGTTVVIDYTFAVTTRVGGFNVVTLTGTVVGGNAHQGATVIKTVELTPIETPRLPQPERPPGGNRRRSAANHRLTRSNRGRAVAVGAWATIHLLG